MDTKKLRQKILDLAIRGKLVPQDPNDEPASVLLERIRAEKERLIKDGKIKRSKQSATDDEIEAPFEIPESWEWCKLSDIASYGGGKTPSMENKQYWSNGTNLWVTSKDMKYERISDSLMKISDDALPIMTQYDPGTILLVTRSGILRHSLPIAILERKATVNQDLKTISLYFKELHEFIYYVIKARETFILKEYHKDGTTVDSINFEKFSEILIPIPPFAEQRRIVNTIEHWFVLIDELENNEGDLLKAIDQAKSKILDLAIHGKLVPQDPNDEPAIELLKRINPKFEVCDNFPFEIPQSWEWTTIRDITINRDAERIPLSLAVRKKQLIKEYDYYGAAGVIDKVEGYLFDERLLLIGEDGANLLSRSKDNAFFAEGKYWVNNHAHVLDCPNKSVLDYVAFVINSMPLDDFITGSAQPKLTQEKLNKIPIPLPPLAEQHRIVAKIEELFAVLDSIKESLE